MEASTRNLDPRPRPLAVITGTGGLGLQAAIALAEAGCTIVLAGRNAEAGRAAVGVIGEHAPATPARFEQLDLASLDSVRAMADRLVADGAPVDVLVCNAGVMSPPQRRLTKDGFELQLGVNYLAHFVLTAQLLPLLRQSAAARIVSVTSLAHRYAKLDYANLQSELSYVPGKAYCVSKFAQAVFAQELQRCSDAGGWGLKSMAAHPGFARTSLFQADHSTPGGLKLAASQLLGRLLGQSASAGAQPIVYAATEPDARPGRLYGPKGLFEMKGPAGLCKFAPASEDPALASRLWALSEELTSCRFTVSATSGGE